jgi:hypothetical protein
MKKRLVHGDRFRFCFAPFPVEGDVAMTPRQIAVVENADARELCKAVSEEEDPAKIRLLLDELYYILDERQFLAALL